MGLYGRLGITLVLFITLLSFQNCGSLNSGMESKSSDSNAQLNDGSFFKGEPYDPDLIPFELTDQAAVDAARTYLNRQGYRTMAFTEDGDIYIANSGNNALVENQDDWDEAVLERCQLTHMNKPCSLFASGDLIAQDRADFVVGFNSKITVPATFDGNLLPGPINYWQKYQAANYGTGTPTYQSMAIGRNGASHNGWSDVSQAESDRRALEFCESVSDLTCTLYAQGMNVVFDLNSYQWEPRRVFYGPRDFNVDEIPFVTESVRETIRSQYGGSNLPYFALALDRYGRWESIRSSSPIVQADLDTITNQCNLKIPVVEGGAFQKTCFIYSIDAQVVLTRDEFRATSLGY